MNTLKKMILGILMTASATAFCNEEPVTEMPVTEVNNSYNYWGIGVGIPTFVSVKLGHREQRNHQGFEYGVGVTPLVYVTEGHIFGSYLYYPNPNLRAQSYLGVGLKTGGFLQMHRDRFGYVAPGFVLGREYLSCAGGRRFIQVAYGPGALTTEGLKSWSSISLAFGYGF